MFDSHVIYHPRGSEERFIIRERWVEEYLKDDELTREEVEILPTSEATAEELADFIGEELENENYHSLTAVASNVLKELQREGIEEKLQLKVLTILGTELLKNI